MTAIAPSPDTKLDQRFSSPGAEPVPWERACEVLDDAGAYWISTVTSNGQPHVTTIAGVWMDGALYFATGPTEQKSRNLAQCDRCTITTGCNQFDSGLDVVVEGSATVVSDEPLLERVAQAYESKYSNFFKFEVENGAFRNEAGGVALVYRVAPRRAFGFAKGEPFGQTRWTFDRGDDV